jgi:ribosomal-protein-alanine N-acetyltransferase
VRVVPWPRRPDIAQLVLLDHHMVPGGQDIEHWLGLAAARGAHTARTNALFPAAAEIFAAAGFHTIDTLTLLELDLSADLPAAAEIDRRAFGDEWSNDVDSLDDVRAATPHHRSRVVCEGGRVVGFAISGRAAGTGYIQRLAVDPAFRRRGHAVTLVRDALGWMARRSIDTVLVNTATSNDAALALYRAHGFRRRDQPLRIMERPLDGGAP